MAAASAGANNALDTTPGKGNFQRLTRLLIAGGTSVLREVFDSIHAPTTLPALLASSSVKTKLSRARLTKPQWDSLYPAPGCYGKSSDFDITLLFKLLRTICSLPSPSSGWDNLPSATDQSVCDDLARVKFYRNDVYGHVGEAMEIGDDDFNDLWVEISGALIRLAHSVNVKKKQEWQEAIAKLHSDPLTPEDERNTEELKVWYRSDFETKEMLDQFREEMGREFKQTHEEIEQIKKKIEQPEAGASLTIFIKGDIAVGMDGKSLPAPAVDEIMRTVAGAYLKSSPLRSLEDCNTFRMFMEKARKPFIVKQEEVLKGMWEDYFSGALNEAVQRCIFTALSKCNEEETRRNCKAELTEMNELRECNRTDSTIVSQTELLNNSFHSKLMSVKTVEGDPKMSGVQESDESPYSHPPQEYLVTSVVDFFEVLSELRESTEDALREWCSKRQKVILLYLQMSENLVAGAGVAKASFGLVLGGFITSFFTLGAGLVVSAVGAGLGAAGGLTLTGSKLAEYILSQLQTKEVQQALDEDREASEALRRSFERVDLFFAHNSALICRNLKDPRLSEGFGMEGTPEMFPAGVKMDAQKDEQDKDTRDTVARLLQTLDAGLTVAVSAAVASVRAEAVFNTQISAACPAFFSDDIFVLVSYLIERHKGSTSERVTKHRQYLAERSYPSEEEVHELVLQYMRDKFLEILRVHAQQPEGSKSED